MRSLVAGGALDEWLLASDHWRAMTPTISRGTTSPRPTTACPAWTRCLNLMLDAVLAEDGWLTGRQLVELLCTGPARRVRRFGARHAFARLPMPTW